MQETPHLASHPQAEKDSKRECQKLRADLQDVHQEKIKRAETQQADAEELERVKRLYNQARTLCLYHPCSCGVVKQPSAGVEWSFLTVEQWMLRPPIARIPHGSDLVMFANSPTARQA